MRSTHSNSFKASGPNLRVYPSPCLLCRQVSSVGIMLFSLFLGTECTSEECFPHVAGINAQFCCSFYSVPLCDISSVAKQFAWSVHYIGIRFLSEISKINLIKELLYVKYKMLSHLLLDCNDVDFITLRASCGAVYCNRSCLNCVCLWVCYHDNSKLRASILTKLGL